MKTLLLNPPSFRKFDGGAGARYPATREITTYWYPTWLAYPAGLIRESRLLDAPVENLGPEEAIRIAATFDFAVIFSSTAGLKNDILFASMLKTARPAIKICLVGPHVSVLPEETLNSSDVIDFVVRREFDYAVAEFAAERRLEDIAGVSFRRNGRIVHSPDRPFLDNLDELPFAVEIFKRDLDCTRYSIPFLLHPYVSIYTSRGCPARCTFCLWPQTMSGHRLRERTVDNVIAEVKRAYELLPGIKEIFFDDDTFTWRKPRVIEFCRKLKPLKIQWSCNSRVTTDLETLSEMKASGCRLLVTGFESGDARILKNIKKGITLEQGLAYMKNCRKLGLKVHGDFQIGHPGETPDTVARTMEFAMRLDPETMQVSISHPYPGTEFFKYLGDNGFFTVDPMTDEHGHQLPNFEYPGLSRSEIFRAVSEFYSRYYFRPRIIFRILKKALFDSAERRRMYMYGKEFLRFRSQSKNVIGPRRRMINN